MALRTVTVGLTLGDPAGIGPELVEHALAQAGHRFPGVVFRVIGKSGSARPGKPSKASARFALHALEESVALLKLKEIDAVVNGPVCKAGLQSVGFPFPGQTEFYAAAFGKKEDDVTMVLTSDELTVGLVSIHCALSAAIKKLSSRRIVAHGRRTASFLQLLHKGSARLAVCGLNPHASEDGAFGSEEKRIIAPAVRLLQSAGIKATGPHVPDAVFRHAVEGRYDGVLCMYHDQGLIPLKLVGFDSGVNITAGLPVWRVSPDHGTAFDIAGTGKAAPSSFFSAISLATRLARAKRS